jgi:hypothetical protein
MMGQAVARVEDHQYLLEALQVFVVQYEAEKLVDPDQSWASGGRRGLTSATETAARAGDEGSSSCSQTDTMASPLSFSEW